MFHRDTGHSLDLCYPLCAEQTLDSDMLDVSGLHGAGAAKGHHLLRGRDRSAQRSSQELRSGLGDTREMRCTWGSNRLEFGV